MLWLIVDIGILVLLVATFLIVLYNRPVRLRNRAENAWAQVDVQLRRRYDLIPNLVETVKGNASHERATFEELWERFLVYGIAFGIAERVLQGAQLHMPRELHDRSSFTGSARTANSGSGPSALGIGDLSAGFGSSLAPPSSGSGRFGGGFSGGGGGGGAVAVAAAVPGREQP